MQTTALELRTQTSAAKSRTAPMSLQATDKLLDLLCTDDRFRAQFQRDARSALVQAGFDQDTVENFWYDCKIGITLASKSAISEARDAIASMLMRGLAQTTPNLDAGSSIARRLRQ